MRDGFSWEGLRWSFTQEHQSNWHPLTWLSHMLDVQVFGKDPTGPHAVNVGLHAVNAVLLFLLLAGATSQIGPSLAVAALFALHPVHVESVAWISQRKTLLATLFALLALLAYVRWVRAGSRGAYRTALACFGLSLMAKQLFVTLPFVLLLLDYWPLRRPALEPSPGQTPTLRSLAAGGLRLVPEKLPFLVLACLASAITLIVQQGAMASTDWLPPSARLANATLAYVRYLGLFVWPANLAVFHPLHVEEISVRAVLGASVLLLLVTGLCLRTGLRRRFLLVGWLWFLGTLVPMIGLVQVGAQAFAERYAYVPFWGIAIAVVWTVWDVQMIHRGPRALASTSALLLVAILTVSAWTTFRRAAVWRDTLTLFEDAVARTRGNWVAHRALADGYYAAGDPARALEHCRAALPYGRDLGTLGATCGLAAYALGRVDEAIAYLEAGVEASPDDPTSRATLGWLLGDLGDLARADRLLAEAEERLDARATPYAWRSVYANRGLVLARLGRRDEARERIARPGHRSGRSRGPPPGRRAAAPDRRPGSCARSAPPRSRDRSRRRCRRRPDDACRSVERLSRQVMSLRLALNRQWNHGPQSCRVRPDWWQGTDAADFRGCVRGDILGDTILIHLDHME